MKLNSIRWRLAFSYAAIALLAAFSLGLVLRTVLRSYYDVQETRYLQERAMRIGLVTAQLIDANVPPQLLQDQSTSWSFFLKARVKIQDPSGEVIADSGLPDKQQFVFFTSALPFPMSVGSSQTAPVPNQSFSVQIIQGEPLMEAGVQGVEGDFVIFSPDSVGVAMPADDSMYGLFNFQNESISRRSSQIVEQPILGERGDVIGRLILSDGPAYGDEILNNVMRSWVFASVIAILLAALAGWFFSTRITTPITALTQITTRMANGDLSARANVSSKDELGVLSNSFNDMASQVEEIVGTLRSFVADAAHELHTPLTALQTNLELAQDETNASSLTLYLTRAQEQSQKLEALVKSLLDLSRIESSTVQSDNNSVNISEMIRETAEQFASRAEQSNRIFSLNLLDETLQATGDSNQLKQVLINLLENALKFTREKDSIDMSVEKAENNIQIKIKDTGIGIPPEDLPHLFERFHRGRNVSDFSGNGLGLAIVKAIVESHDGSVDVKSEGVNQGSEFVITLPARL